MTLLKQKLQSASPQFTDAELKTGARTSPSPARANTRLAACLPHRTPFCVLVAVLNELDAVNCLMYRDPVIHSIMHHNLENVRIRVCDR